MDALHKNLLDGLPVTRSGMSLRLLGRTDLDKLAAWPSYPWPHHAFRFRFSSFGKREMNIFFAERAVQDERISLVADSGPHTAIGYVSLVDIDWGQTKTRNVGMRVHPDWCDKGIGTRMLRMVQDWWLAAEMEGLCMDVAATNGRAIACYRKAGFRKTGEFWRDAPDLAEMDLDDPRCAFLKQHVRTLRTGTQIRFCWMEWQGHECCRRYFVRFTFFRRRPSDAPPRSNPDRLMVQLWAERWRRYMMKTGFKQTVFLICVASMIGAALHVRPVFADVQQTYTVESGDTMLKIAARHGLNVNELAAANSLEWNDWVYVGQRLAIPIATDDLSPAPSEPEAGPLYATDPRVPSPLPELPVLAQELPSTLVPFTYARVVQDDAPVYASPLEAVQGASPKRTLGTGFVWVSLGTKTTQEDQDFYEINAEEYVRAQDLSIIRPSGFQGVALAAQPERPFAWILKPVTPQLTPGGATNPEARVYQRYDLVQIFAAEILGDQRWYLIGPHQWINQITVGKITPSARPDAIPADAAWVEVDLFEQTLAAYVGDQMVYATLVSSGLRGWDTPPGLFQVWLKIKSRKMSGGANRPDYYFLEDVPWTMYFDRDIALHTAYWHDGFGYRRSHGCVNLAPLDARWLFDWAPEALSVWVHAALTAG